MDAVYILKKKEDNDYRELQYSLRSLAMNMIDLDHVVIVGHKPDWVTNIHHIPADDPHSDRWRNAVHKTTKACEDENISDEFVLMNDDFYWLYPMLGAELPYFAKKGSDGGPNGFVNFSIHCPIRIKKELYPKMPINELSPGQFSPRSFYANYYNAPPEAVQDFVLKAGEGMPDYDTQVVGWPFASSSDSVAQFSSFYEWCELNWPSKCQFEI